MPALSAVDLRLGSVRPSAVYRGSQMVWSDSGLLYPAGMRTLSEPAAGTTLASGGNLATAISGLSSGETLYLASGGTYTLTATTTMPNTKPGIKIATVPGGTPATITGNFQFRMYGANQELWRVKFNQGYVAGKNVEVSGDGQSIVECDFTNGFNTAAPAANAGAMVLFTTDGPDGVCTDFLMYGCSFHQIGKVNSTFDHALYLKELNGGLFHSNTFYQIHGGYSFHSYPNTKNVEIAYNKHESGLFTTLWEDVPGTETGNYYHHNAWHNTYTGMAHAPVEGNPVSGSNNRYQRNAGLNTNTAQGGTSGISVSAGFAVSDNAALDPQFGNPAAGDWAIGNQAVIDHLAGPSAPAVTTILDHTFNSGVLAPVTSAQSDAFGSQAAFAYSTGNGTTSPNVAPPGVSSTHCLRCIYADTGGIGDSSKFYHHYTDPAETTGVVPNTYPGPIKIASRAAGDEGGRFETWVWMPSNFTMTIDGFSNMFQFKVGYTNWARNDTMSWNYFIIGAMRRAYLTGAYGRTVTDGITDVNRPYLVGPGIHYMEQTPTIMKWVAMPLGQWFKIWADLVPGTSITYGYALATGGDVTLGTVTQAQIQAALTAGGWVDSTTDFRGMRPRSVGYPAAADVTNLRRHGTFNIKGAGPFSFPTAPVTMYIGRERYVA